MVCYLPSCRCRCKAYVVKIQGRELPAIIKLSDPGNDVALLKLEGCFTPLEIRSSSGVSLGTDVMTIGFPNPDIQGMSPKLTKGEVSCLAGLRDDPRVFQISAPIQPGNSGGALTDSRGKVVGVLCSKLSDLAGLATSGSIPQNVNYALKSAYLLALIEAVPELPDKLRRGPATDESRDDVVQWVERASGLVMVDL